jgi:pimeloyl-ACP methyl ester carboxylesterase
MSSICPRAAALLGLGLATIAASALAVESEDVTFSSGDLTLAATIYVPDGAGPFPGVVLVHGSGASDRSNPWTSAYAEALVARGVAVLYPDKRGSGESEGDWHTASLLDLADDAVAAATRLGSHPGVDGSNVGLIGFSQGGDVVPAAAARDPTIAFVIDVSGSVVPMLEQVGDEVLIAAEQEGLGEKDQARIERIHEQSVRYVRTGSGWDAYEEALRDAKEAGLAGRDVVERFPTDPHDPLWDFARRIGDFDPMDYWPSLRIPVLFVYGGHDTRLRVSKSVARIQAELDPAGANYTLLLFGLNGHALIRDDQLDLIVRWIRDRGAK